MTIETFVNQSLGSWTSMRSGHSLAFQQFEEIVSNIEIKLVSKKNQSLIDLLKTQNIVFSKIVSPFIISWVAESDWDPKEINSDLKGSSIIVPIPMSKNKGIMLRSYGYSENIQVKSKYNFLNDQTLTLSTRYNQTLAEERIWFLSENVRCRSSVIRSLDSNAILQTSYASEIRKLNI